MVKKHARCRYTTIQNWANNIYNLVTKRAMAYEGAFMEWIDGNLGSRLTMKYPSVYMMEPGARGEILSIAFSSAGQHQDAGAKLVHVAPHTSGRIISKSISKNGGRSSYRGLVKVEAGAKKAKSNVVCDALILDSASRSDTYPYIEVEEQDVSIGHEASVSRIGEEQWARTDIRPFRLEQFGFPPEGAPAVDVPDGLLAHQVDLAGQTVALDSHSHTARLDKKWDHQGVLFDSLDKLVVEHGDLIRP